MQSRGGVSGRFNFLLEMLGSTAFLLIGSSDWDQPKKKKKRAPVRDPSKNSSSEGYPLYSRVEKYVAAVYSPECAWQGLPCCFYRATCCKLLVGLDLLRIFIFYVSNFKV